jgi:hypothetical protein
MTPLSPPLSPSKTLKAQLIVTKAKAAAKKATKKSQGNQRLRASVALTDVQDDESDKENETLED